jgi:hypothetical protein
MIEFQSRFASVVLSMPVPLMCPRALLWTVAQSGQGL